MQLNPINKPKVVGYTIKIIRTKNQSTKYRGQNIVKADLSSYRQINIKLYEECSMMFSLLNEYN